MSSTRLPIPAPRFPRKQDWAYQNVREQILSGELPAGARIEQEALAASLGISRIPLREALARLEAEGWLVGEPHHGVAVSKNSVEDARDIYASRMAVESTLAAMAAKNSRHRGFLDGAREALGQQGHLLSNGTAEKFHRFDSEFHMGVYELAGLPKTLAVAKTLYSMSERYVRLYLGESFRSADSFREHCQILQAVEQGNADAACELTRAHIARGLSVLEERLLPERFSQLTP